jgi:hypothetical protein
MRLFGFFGDVENQRIATSFNKRLKMAASLLPRFRLTKHVIKLRPCSQGPRFAATGEKFSRSLLKSPTTI